jgi:hypothetical protein
VVLVVVVRQRAYDKFAAECAGCVVGYSGVWSNEPQRRGGKQEEKVRLESTAQ